MAYNIITWQTDYHNTGHTLRNLPSANMNQYHTIVLSLLKRENNLMLKIQSNKATKDQDDRPLLHFITTVTVYSKHNTSDVNSSLAQW